MNTRSAEAFGDVVMRTEQQERLVRSMFLQRCGKSGEPLSLARVVPGLVHPGAVIGLQLRTHINPETAVVLLAASA